MKFLPVVVALLAVSLVQSASVAQNAETYALDDWLALIREIKVQARARVDEIRERALVVRDQLKEATGDARKELQEALEELKQKVREISATLRSEIMKIIKNKKTAESRSVEALADMESSELYSSFEIENFGLVADLIGAVRDAAKKRVDELHDEAQFLREAIQNAIDEEKKVLQKKLEEIKTRIVDFRSSLEQRLSDLLRRSVKSETYSVEAGTGDEDEAATHESWRQVIEDLKLVSEAAYLKLREKALELEGKIYDSWMDNRPKLEAKLAEILKKMDKIASDLVEDLLQVVKRQTQPSSFSDNYRFNPLKKQLISVVTGIATEFIGQNREKIIEELHTKRDELVRKVIERIQSRRAD